MTDKPVDFDALFPGRFLKAGLLEGKQTFTIAAVDVEELVGDKGPQIKGIVSLKDSKFSLVLNKTNGICLRDLFGRSVQAWVGKRITLFASEHDGKPCIRVWGSPEIDRDREIIVALPRKKPLTMVMHATGVKPAAAPKAAPTRPAYGPACLAYGHQLKAAKTDHELSQVMDAIIEDNTLTPEETALLITTEKKYAAQLGAA